MYSKKILNSVADRLGIDPKMLWALIQFESGWNPRAKNPFSTAKGLIQFIDSTAVGLGFRSSQDLIDKLPTADLQLVHAVLPYLSKYKPFITRQSLYMAVFYPDAMYWPELKRFSKRVQEDNPGIKTPYDYMVLVYKRLSLRYIPRLLYLGLGGVILLSLIKKRRVRNDRRTAGGFYNK